ncbi:putative ankyrin repeat-containing domain, PGG domain-containing protein [Lupinus albus]|uniref:Putative ankyrin repeat-containing domain, PGG domain-containing protein n=1 Tax=Lupinus albus TaxID=3870 RepID=A0A6A4N8F5_LUPAL|nr:putative ankyrin repeat-containing domain, PGG domain-containing protein [Lupinus albus]
MAALSIASTGIVLEVLTKDNYENWSTLVENYLVGQGLWHGIVEGDSKIDHYKPDPDWDWISKNSKALHAIQLSCGSDTLGKIRQFKTAKDAWNHLKASFSEDVKAYPDIEQGQGYDRNISKLHSDVKKGYWNDAKSYIINNPNAIFQTSYSTGRTVLHIAVAAGQAKIVKELVKIGNQRLLKMQDKWGYTALALAAELTDNKKIAECMVNKGGKELLTMKLKTKEDDDIGETIPLLLALAKGHREMTRYLFSETPWSVLLEHKDDYGPKLLSGCISAEIFDVAAALLQHRVGRELPLNHRCDHLRPLYALAHMPSAFRSGVKLGWWRGLTYKLLILQRYINFKDKSIQIVSHVEPDEGPKINTLAGKVCKLFPISLSIKLVGQFFGWFHLFVQTSMLLKCPAIKKVYEMKMNHYLVLEILKSLRERISTTTRETDLHACSAYDSMLQAAKYGIIEFIDSMRRANPDLLWAIDKNKRGIFSHAILNRQEKVFKLIHETKGLKDMISFREDVFGNNMLHLAAELGPSSVLGGISNAALQMQRELQWFMAVKSIVPPKCEEARNKDGKKPRELFSKTHEDLLKAGEKWAKDTAGSFTVVGALIVTMLFAAAFTVPGGNNQDTGKPVFLGKDVFSLFIVADAFSLVTSASSVLIFIGILTSRYAEEDFRSTLPIKLLFGLITLFLSVASMMCAFSAALIMMLKGYRGLIIVAMLLSVIPVLVLLPTQLQFSFEIINSTMRFDFLTDKKKRSRD